VALPLEGKTIRDVVMHTTYLIQVGHNHLSYAFKRGGKETTMTGGKKLNLI